MKKEDLPFITQDELKMRCAKGVHTLSQFQDMRPIARIPYDCPNLFGKGTYIDFYYVNVATRKCAGCEKVFLIEDPKIIGEYKPHEKEKV